MQKLVLVRYNKLTESSEFFSGYETESKDSLRWASLDFACLLTEALAEQLLRYISLQDYSKRYAFFTKAVDFYIEKPYTDI